MNEARLMLTCGLPGAGKTTLATQLAAERSAVRLTKDEWLWAVGSSPWDTSTGQKMEQELWRLAQEILRLGVNVVLDFGLWARIERDEMRTVARGLGVGVELHYLDVPTDELWRRIDARNSSPPWDRQPIGRADLEEWLALLQAPDAAELDPSRSTGTRHGVESSNGRALTPCDHDVRGRSSRGRMATTRRLRLSPLHSCYTWVVAREGDHRWAHRLAMWCAGLAGFQALLAAGAPWGAAAWGGQHPGVLPRRLRLASAVTAPVVLGLGAAVAGPCIGADGRRRILTGVAAYGGVGIVLNAISRSKPERIVGVPLSAAGAGLALAARRELGARR